MNIKATQINPATTAKQAERLFPPEQLVPQWSGCSVHLWDYKVSMYHCSIDIKPDLLCREECLPKPPTLLRKLATCTPPLSSSPLPDKERGFTIIFGRRSSNLEKAEGLHHHRGQEDVLSLDDHPHLQHSVPLLFLNCHAELMTGQTWEQAKKTMAYFLLWEVIKHPVHVRHRLQEIKTILKATNHCNALIEWGSCSPSPSRDRKNSQSIDRMGFEDFTSSGRIDRASLSSSVKSLF